MAKNKATAYMSAGEQIAGVVFLALYLAVLPFAVTPLFDLAERLLGTNIPSGLRDVIYYYVLFAVTIVIFHGFIARTTKQFSGQLAGSCQTVVAGLIALYGLNELAYRLTRLLVGSRVNLNDSVVSAQTLSAPRSTLLIVVFLAPFVEEVLFRGLVFGNLKRRSRVLAYTVSCLLFAAVHVWQFALAWRDMSYFLVMVQYLVPGLVLAWAFDHSGTLWSAIGVHAAANALSMWIRL